MSRIAHPLRPRFMASCSTGSALRASPPPQPENVAHSRLTTEEGVRPRRTECLCREEDALTDADIDDPASEVPAVAAVWTLDLSGTTIEFRARSSSGLLKIRESFKAVEKMAPVQEGGVDGRCSDEVVALFDVLDEAGMCGLPTQELLGDGA